MTEPLNVSPLLAELQRLHLAQDSMALMPTPMFDMSAGSMSVDPIAVASMVEMQGQIGSLISDATDEDLLRAYQETDGEPDSLNAETLLSEIERRNLNI